jgi:hypothetical protein
VVQSPKEVQQRNSEAHARKIALETTEEANGELRLPTELLWGYPR